MKQLLATLALLALAFPAFAGTAPTTTTPVVGGVEFKAILMLFMGPVGLAMGLIVTVFGIWAFFVSQKFARGIILCILGVSISCFPVIFKGIRQDLYGAVKQIGGSGEGSDFSQFVN